MKPVIYYINRYSPQKREYPKEHSGYEQVVKYYSGFRSVRASVFIGKIVFGILKIEKPFRYKEMTAGEELALFFKAFFSGKPVFYLYADKDAFLLPLLKRKFGLRRIKLYGTLHWPEEVSQDFSFYKHNLASQFNGIISLSHSLVQKAGKGMVIPHGIDTDFWQKDSPHTFENLFLILGTSNRNHAAQIEIVRQISSIDPMAKFILLMQDHQIIDQYRVIPKIKIIDWRISDEELKRLYAKSKAVILMQLHCLASNVVLECISMKTPLIANKVGDIGEYLGSEYPLYVAGNPQETKIQNICNSPAFRMEVVNYLAPLGNKFEWKAIAEKTVDFIRNG